jgi:hypothetical protein
MQSIASTQWELKELFSYSESGGSEDEIAQFCVQMPKMENAIKCVYAVAVKGTFFYFRIWWECR